MLFLRRSLLRRIRYQRQRPISESRTQHTRAGCETALERFQGVVAHVSNAKGRALKPAVTIPYDNSTLRNGSSEALGRKIRRKPNGRNRWRLGSQRSNVVQLLSGFVTDLYQPLLGARSHRFVPCPSRLEPLRRNRFKLRFERVKQTKSGRARRLIAARVCVELDEVEIDTPALSSVGPVDKARRCSPERESRWKCQSFLRASQYIIEIPFVEAKLCSAKSAHAIDQTYQTMTVCAVRDGTHIVECARRCFRMNHRHPAVLPHCEALFQLGDRVHLSPCDIVAVDVATTH